MAVLFYYFLLLNFGAFFITGYDKKLAISNKKRVSEKTLLTFSLFGGTVGSLFAMLLFRHKTAKRSFLLKFFLIVFVQIVLAYFLFKNNLI